MPVKMGFWGAKWNSANPSCSLASRGRFVPLVGRWLVFSSFRYLPPPLPARGKGGRAGQVDEMFRPFSPFIDCQRPAFATAQIFCAR